MHRLWYFLTLVFGGIGLVAVFRIFEILGLGVSVLPATQLFIALIALLFAFLSFAKPVAQRNNEIQPAARTCRRTRAGTSVQVIVRLLKVVLTQIHLVQCADYLPSFF